MLTDDDRRAITEYVAKLVDDAPPLTPEQVSIIRDALGAPRIRRYERAADGLERGMAPTGDGSGAASRRWPRAERPDRADHAATTRPSRESIVNRLAG